MITLLLMACGAPARDLVLDFEGDRHFATGDAYRIDDADCTGPVEVVLDGTGSLGVQNDYLETTVDAVLVSPGCEETDWLTLPPGTSDQDSVALPAVVRIYADDELLSAWTLFTPGSGGTVVAQP